MVSAGWCATPFGTTEFDTPRLAVLPPQLGRGPFDNSNAVFFPFLAVAGAVTDYWLSQRHDRPLPRLNSSWRRNHIKFCAR
jgi:hypothetical protein